MIRVLSHDTDPDARLVAVLMHKLGIESFQITNADEMAASAALYTRRVVMGQRSDGSVQVVVVPADAVPGPDEVFQ